VIGCRLDDQVSIASKGQGFLFVTMYRLVPGLNKLFNLFLTIYFNSGLKLQMCRAWSSLTPYIFHSLGSPRQYISNYTLTDQQSIISQKTWLFNNTTTVRSSNCARNKIFVWAHNQTLSRTFWCTLLPMLFRHCTFMGLCMSMIVLLFSCLKAQKWIINKWYNCVSWQVGVMIMYHGQQATWVMLTPYSVTFEHLHPLPLTALFLQTEPSTVLLHSPSPT
jgi:hypothetical protein